MIATEPAPIGARCRHDLLISCSNCRMAQVCLPMALQSSDIEQLDSIIQRGRPLHAGEHVYRGQDAFTAIYAVRSGALKTYSIAEDGTEQVTGFYFPGEIFGLDGIGQSQHLSSAIALETSTICEIPFARLGVLSARIPNLQQHFFKLMSQEISADQHMITMLSKHTAEQRIATLFQAISLRNTRHKLSATALRLPMSRADIGNYLGVTVETISRVLSRLQKLGVLAVNNREITILQGDQLDAIARGA